ncbi:MAG TPA: helix-turn-helix domain-containing protein [Chondromyces sp.]|nr:helix-turn-helix domain-containing protein [Chondromyces sp.]
MKGSKVDTLLHPVRMRIVQTLVNGRRLTVQQIGEQLPDIPQASLYRHLKKLLEAGLIIVVEEHQVRGTIEKVYALPEQTAQIDTKEFLRASKEEHLSYFIKFMATVLADFERYISQEEFDFQRDGAGYRQGSFYASDDEYEEFLQAMAKAFEKVISNEPSSQRRKRIMTTIFTTENYTHKEGKEQ